MSQVGLGGGVLRLLQIDIGAVGPVLPGPITRTTGSQGNGIFATCVSD